MAHTLRRFLSAPRYRIAILSASLAAAYALGAAPAFAQPKGAAPAAASSDANPKKALELFKKGQGLYKANKFAEALPLFRESYQLVASPNSRFYVARCLAGTGDNVGAYVEFEAVIADIDARAEAKYKDTRDVAAQERTDVAAKIALLTVNVANAGADTRLSVAGVDIARDAWGKPIPLAPGAVEVVLTRPPAAPESQRLELRAGDKRPLELDAAIAAAPPPPPPPGAVSAGSRRVLRPIAYLAGGIGVAGMGVFAAFGVMANGTYSQLEKDCSKAGGTRVCPSTSQKQIDDGKLQKDIANIGLIAGAAGLATGVTLFILSRDSSPKTDEAPTVQPVVGPAYLGVQGSF